MPRLNRSEICALDEVQVFHLISRCIRRTYLSGKDQKGCLPMSLEDYLALVEWTGRAYRKDKVGKIPEQCQPLFQRLKCDGETWLEWVKNFRQRFRNEVGRPTSRQAFKADRRVRSQATA